MQMLLQSSNVKSYRITFVCVCDIKSCSITLEEEWMLKNEESTLLLKKNGWIEIRGKRFDQWWSMKEEVIHVHKNPPIRKNKVLTFEKRE